MSRRFYLVLAIVAFSCIYYLTITAPANMLPECQGRQVKWHCVD